MEEQNIDFMSYGMRVAKEHLLNIEKLSNEIKEKYGEQAQLEFDSGVAMAIPSYAKVGYSSPASTVTDKIEEDKERGR